MKFIFLKKYPVKAQKEAYIEATDTDLFLQIDNITASWWKYSILFSKLNIRYLHLI